jgi:hypothetical protein
MTGKAMTRKIPFRSAIGPLGFLVAVLALIAPASAEWKEKVLYSFQGGTDGATPAGGVVFDAAGNLYGATTDGGSSNCPGIAQCGTVFQLQPPPEKGDSWTENQLYIFKGKNSNDGETPAGGVIFDQAGNLYGTTAYGGSGDCILLGTAVGCGVVFQMKPPRTKGGDWTETVLYSFKGGKDGYLPQGNLTFDGAGNLYGATEYGGGYGSCNAPYYQYCGTIFELSPPETKHGKWTEKVLYSFKSGTDGANPNGSLVLDSKGAIYGTTYAGGNQDCKADSSVGCGTAFELKLPANKGATWIEKMLHRFADADDGAQPGAGVIIDANGSLYGAAEGGAKGGGVVFRFAITGDGRWKETVLYDFTVGPEGGYDPSVTLFGKSGDIYGTTNVGPGESVAGSVFRLNPSSREDSAWAISILHGFRNRPDGAFPNTPLIADESWSLYGATQSGGTGQSCQGGCGTVFEVEP